MAEVRGPEALEDHQDRERRRAERVGDAGRCRRRARGGGGLGRVRFYSPWIALVTGRRSGSGSLSATTGFRAAALLEETLLSSGLRTVESSSSWVISCLPEALGGKDAPTEALPRRAPLRSVPACAG